MLLLFFILHLVVFLKYLYILSVDLQKLNFKSSRKKIIIIWLAEICTDLVKSNA